MPDFFILTLAASMAAPPEMPRIKPLEPEQALASFVVRPGFKVELVAAEPLVQSPVAIDWDENGAIYVAEYPEYNQYANPGFKGKGRIRKLTSSKGDGKYDTATTFADNLDTPCALVFANGGLYVGAPPHLWFLKDTKGTGVADVRRKVLTGFGRDPAGEGMLNSFHWTLEGKILISTGHAGGDLRKADDPNAKPVAIRRQNILFDPRKETFEFTSGGGQHGLALTDWGDVFVCDNSHPVQYVQYDQREIRNPYVDAPPAIVNVHPFGSSFKIGRISPPEPWRVIRTQMRTKKEFYGSDEGGEPFGFFTGATGITIYRGDAWPGEFRGNAFVGDVANNLTYRAKLTRDGLHWKAERAEPGPEFLASKDVWHRPVQYANGPDGCLYVIDMYRELIECASCIPGDVLKGVDVAGGINRGRIYRIVPDGVTLRPPPKLGAASTKELVALLDHRNSWHRETAARLLGERQEQSSAQDLRDLTKSKNPVTRVQARYALIVLNAWTVNDALAAFREPNVEAMIHTLRQASNHVNNPGIAGQLGSVIFTSREIRERREALAICGPELSILPFMMRKDISEYSDPLMRLAFLANIGDRSASLFAALSQYPTEFVGSTHARSLLKALVEQVGSSHDARQIAIVVASIDALPENALRTDLSLSFVMKLSLKDREKLGNGVAARVLTEAITKSTENALDGKITLAKRAAAIRSLKIATWEEAGSVLKAGLDFKQPPAVQSAALETLAAFDVAEVPPIILKVWPSLTPAVRATALETLLARKTGTVAFLDSLESKAIRSADLDPARVQILLKTLDEPLKSRAAKLLGTQALSPRKDVIEKYKPALEKQGDVAKGKIIFKNVCSACHKLDGVGQEVGPDLSTQRVKGAESILVNVLDPNREVLPKYYTYKVTTDAGATITGLITADTATSVTIRRADGTSTTIARANIEDMKSTGLSAMPEGLEQQIDVASFADLLAYLMANR